jgi:hypothetical protein
MTETCPGLEDLLSAMAEKIRSMAGEHDQEKQVKCPWCGRMVGFSRSDRIEPHVGLGGIKCVGVGQPRHQVLEEVDAVEEVVMNSGVDVVVSCAGYEGEMHAVPRQLVLPGRLRGSFSRRIGYVYSIGQGNRCLAP